MGKDGQQNTKPGSATDHGPDEIDEELFSGSDRAVAVLCQAMLEKTIKDALGSIFHPETKETVHLIGDDERPGVLGFADQCRLAYCLKIVPAQVYADLLNIGKIRNRFGHSPEAMSFTTRSIKDRCNALKTFNGIPRFTPPGKHRVFSVGRERYMRCVFAIKKTISRKMRNFHMGEYRRLDRLIRKYGKCAAKGKEFTPTSLDPTVRFRG
jgi:DNA-binding MltR family transcriptional regulator